MTNQTIHEVDPFTLEIVKDSLKAIGEETFYTLQRTAMSPIIYEILDYVTGLTDSKGRLLTQGNGITVFVGMLPNMVMETLNRFGSKGDLNPGDIIIMNDPYFGGGSHLNDIGMVMPIFFEGELVAFSTNKAHWSEVGGKNVGSFATDSTDIYQEGLQIPCLKLFNGGHLNQFIVDIIAENVRFPDRSLGDMWAQIASLRIGEKRFVELCHKYGKDVVMASIDYLLKHGEEMSRKRLAEIPKGTFEAEDYIDDDGLGNGPFRVQVKVTITDDKFICDFRGSHPQVRGPVNCSYTSLVSSARTAFLAVTNPSEDVNDGMFRPLEVIVDEGSIFSAVKPAPVSMYFHPINYAIWLIGKALIPVIPERLTAGNHLSVCIVTIAGKHHEANEPFLLVEPSVGGWGAGSGKDGESGQFSVADGETFNIPVEVAESRYGVMLDEYSLRADGVGAGEFRGGSGVIRSYRVLTDNQALVASFERHKYLPWGSDGGGAGSSNRIEIVRANGEIEGPFGKCNVNLNKNDVIRLITGSGGGYGDAFKRPVEKILTDVRNGFVTVEQAKNDYGVSIHPQTFEFEHYTSERLSKTGKT